MNDTRFKSFEELDCWKESASLRRMIRQMVKGFPNEEKYRLTDQLIRCSRSVTNNIAEGFGRFHYQENIQFCRQGRGSLYEVLDHILIALEENYITEEQLVITRKQIEKCTNILNGYINYLERAKASQSQKTNND